jgi:hypothetical protein
MTEPARRYASITLRPSIHVPFVLPRSRSKNPAEVATISRWNLETVESSSTRSFPSRVPIR